MSQSIQDICPLCGDWKGAAHPDGYCPHEALPSDNGPRSPEAHVANPDPKDIQQRELDEILEDLVSATMVYSTARHNGEIMKDYLNNKFEETKQEVLELTQEARVDELGKLYTDGEPIYWSPNGTRDGSISLEERIQELQGGSRHE